MNHRAKQIRLREMTNNFFSRKSYLMFIARPDRIKQNDFKKTTRPNKTEWFLKTILNRAIMSENFSCKCPYNGQGKVDKRQLPKCNFAINICLDFLWKTHLGQKWKSSSCLPFVRASKWVMFCPKSGRVCLSQVHFPLFASARALGFHTLINDI